MTPWVERSTLDIDLDLPIKQRFAAIDDEAVAAGKRLLDAVMAEMPPRLMKVATLARWRTANRFHSEVKALAARVDADWRQVMLANISYDLAIAMIGCSTVALPTKEGPVLARNMDWFPEHLLAQGTYILRHVRHGKLEWASASWPGTVGVVTGMSHRGFAFAINAVSGPDGPERMGYPVLLHLRRVLEDAKGFDHAMDMLANQKLTVGALFTLIGTENDQRVVIERSPRKHAIRRPTGDGPLVTTNDYRLLYEAGTHAEHEFYESTCGRFDALCGFFAKHESDQPVEDEALLNILSDPKVKQGITAQHVIMRPRQQTMRLFVPRDLLEEPTTTP